MTSSHTPSKNEVLAKIEQIFGDIADKLREQEDLANPLVFKKRARTLSSQHDSQPAPLLENVMFPGRSPREARRFGRSSKICISGLTPILSVAVIIRILGFIHEALCENIVVSKRCLTPLTIWILTLYRL